MRGKYPRIFLWRLYRIWIIMKCRVMSKTRVREDSADFLHLSLEVNLWGTRKIYIMP